MNVNASPRQIAELLALLLIAGAGAVLITRMGAMIGERATTITRRLV